MASPAAQQTIVNLVDRYVQSETLGEDGLLIAVGLAIDACGSYDSNFNQNLRHTACFQKLVTLAQQSTQAHTRDMAAFLMRINTTRAGRVQ